MATKVFITHSRSETEAVAEALAKEISGGVIALNGDLGAGKTCFTAGLARGLGFMSDVNSPTFAIVNEYKGGKKDIYHFDMYRIDGWEDLYTTGYFEYLESGGVLVIEWSENIASALPEHYLNIVIEYMGESDRKITVEEI